MAGNAGPSPVVDGDAGDRLSLTDYELRHLAAHLELAGREDALHRLLALKIPSAMRATPHAPISAWYSAKLAIGDLAGYLGDVQRAWRIARDAGSVGRAQHGRYAALEVRYALVISSLGSLAGSLPPTLIIRLVNVGIWTLERAIASARQMPDPERRVEALAGLARQPQLDSQLSEQLLLEAVQIATGMGDAYRRAATVVALALALPAHLQQHLHNAGRASPEALEVRYGTGAGGHAAEIAAAETTTPADVEKLLADASAQTRESDRVDRLIRIAPFATGGALDDAMRLATSLTGELQRTFAMAALVPRLVELGRVEEATKVARSVTPVQTSDQGVARLLAMGPESTDGPSALRAAAEGVTDSFWRAELLSRVSGESTAEERTTLLAALDAASYLGDQDARDTVVAQAVGWAVRHGQYAGACELAGAVMSPGWRAYSVARLAERPTADHAQGVLDVARSIADAYWRARALTALAPQVHEGAVEAVRQEVLELSRTAAHDDAVELLLGLADASPQPESSQLVLEAANRASRIADSHLRTRAIVMVLLRAPESVQGELGRQVPGMDDSEDRASVLAASVLALGAAGAADEAFRLADDIAIPYIRDSTLRTLALRVAPAHPAAAVAALRALSPEFVGSPLLAELIGLLPAHLSEAAIDLVLGLPDPNARVVCAARLAACTRGPAGERAHDAAVSALRSGGDDLSRAEAVADLAFMAAGGPQTAELATIVGSLTDPQARALALASLRLASESESSAGADVRAVLEPLDPATRAAVATSLITRAPAPARQRLVAIAASALGDVTDHEQRVEFLTELVQWGSDMDGAAARRCWSDALAACAAGGRGTVLATLAALLPLAAQFADGSLVVDTANEVLEVSRWWP
jgi:hypothetical protein